MSGEKKKTRKTAEQKTKRSAPKDEEHDGREGPRPLWNRWNLAAEGLLLPSDHDDLMWRAAHHIPGWYHYMVAKGLERGLSGSEYGIPYDPRAPRPDWAEGIHPSWAKEKYHFVPPRSAFHSNLYSLEKGMPPSLRHLRRRQKKEEEAAAEGDFVVPATPSLGLI